MDIYTKLQTCRVELQKLGIKKTGRNAFVGFDYYDLADILPHINALFLENKLFSNFSATADTATLTIVDSEKPDDKIIFSSPFITPLDNTKNTAQVQALGANITYLKRYLYLNALEIVESDWLDGSKPEQPKVEQPIQPKVEQPIQPKVDPKIITQPLSPTYDTLAPKITVAKTVQDINDLLFTLITLNIPRVQDLKKQLFIKANVMGYEYDVVAKTFKVKAGQVNG